VASPARLARGLITTAFSLSVISAMPHDILWLVWNALDRLLVHASLLFALSALLAARGFDTDLLRGLTGRARVLREAIIEAAEAAKMTSAAYGRLAGLRVKLMADWRFETELVAVKATTRSLLRFSAPSGTIQVAAVVKLGSKPSSVGIVASGGEPDDADQS